MGTDECLRDVNEVVGILFSLCPLCLSSNIALIKWEKNLEFLQSESLPVWG